MGDIEIDTSLARKNQGRCYHPSQHCQTMLKAQKHSQKNRHLVVEPKEWSCLLCWLHKWQVWVEEELIVVVTHQPSFCEEGLANTVDMVGHGFLWAPVWPDLIVFGHAGCCLLIDD